MKLEDYNGTEPAFVLEDYLSGRLKAWGLFQDRFGTVRRQFIVDIAGTWDGRQLQLVEDFVFDDGEQEQRIWHVRKLNDGTYEGEAGDVVGLARGRSVGRVFNWRYRFGLRMGKGRLIVDFDDWMFRQDREIMLNRAVISKFGLTLGSVFIAFRKLD